MIVVGMMLWAVIQTGMKQVPVPHGNPRNGTEQVVRVGEHDSEAPPAGPEKSRDDGGSSLAGDTADDESAGDELLAHESVLLPLMQGRERVHYAPRLMSVHVTELLRRPPRQPVA